jgi:hypothetical protein
MLMSKSIVNVTLGRIDDIAPQGTDIAPLEGSA